MSDGLKRIDVLPQVLANIPIFSIFFNNTEGEGVSNAIINPSPRIFEITFGKILDIIFNPFNRLCPVYADFLNRSLSSIKSNIVPSCKTRSASQQYVLKISYSFVL